jgi:hypothetical protein
VTSNPRVGPRVAQLNSDIRIMKQNPTNQMNLKIKFCNLKRRSWCISTKLFKSIPYVPCKSWRIGIKNQLIITSYSPHWSLKIHEATYLLSIIGSPHTFDNDTGHVRIDMLSNGQDTHPTYTIYLIALRNSPKELCNWWGQGCFCNPNACYMWFNNNTWWITPICYVSINNTLCK